MDDIRAAALDLINEIRALYESKDVETALGWVIEITDRESGARELFGSADDLLFFDPVEALRQAQEFERDVNRGNPEGEPGWTCKVRPVQALSERRRGTDDRSTEEG